MAKIKSITIEKNEDVFDITVEGNHNFFANDILVHNCVEVGMFPQLNGVSGFQGCNLTEINGAACDTLEEFLEACEAAAILGTLQAGYTNFKFVSETTRKIFEREALLGVSVTGWMNNPEILFNENNLTRGAKHVLDVNETVANIIGINVAARTTNVKPSGNASVLLMTASGIHGEHAPRYLRNVQMNKEGEVAKLFKDTNPYMVEESVWSAGKSDYVISFPVISKPQSIYRRDLYGVNLLEKVKLVQRTWVEAGTRLEACVDKTVRHNVSNTINVLPHQWEQVEEYLFENRKFFTGVSLLSAQGEYDFNQAPFSEVLTEEEIVAEYGRGAMFASGIIVDAMTGFNNLWDACYIAQQREDFGDKEKVDARADWIRRFRKYASNYFDGNLKRAEYCLKAVYLLHKWVKIQQNMADIDFAHELSEKVYIDIDTMGSAACVGGACEI
jgi:ribonucleoside-triphosphate reductase (thioredoxin)